MVKTADEYIESLTKERRQVLERVRALIRRSLPNGYEEMILYGMITYAVPLSVYPMGYNGKKDQPLPYLSLASQKAHMAIYAMALDAGEEQGIRAEYAKAKKKLDMGKGCIRFRSLDDLVLPAIGKLAGRKTVAQFVAMAEGGPAPPNRESSKKPARRSSSSTKPKASAGRSKT